MADFPYKLPEDHLFKQQHDGKLTVDQLAEALYEGTPHLQNLAEKLARQHGKAGALCFYSMQSPNVRKFWRSIAQQLIDHAACWEAVEGCACVLSEKEQKRLEALSE